MHYHASTLILVLSFPLSVSFSSVFSPIRTIIFFTLYRPLLDMGGVLLSSGKSNNPNTDYPGKLTWFVCITCIVAAMGGLIFGYDIGISGGVTSMAPFLSTFFPSVYRKQSLDHSTNQYCTFNSQPLTFFTSSLYFAAFFASLAASWVTKRLGRKISMLIGGLVFLIGSLLNASAVHVAMLIIGRILLGVGVGFATQSVPLYVSEMAPCKYRGALNVLFQLSITIGILVANVINYFTAQIDGSWGWRISLGGAAVPAIFMAVAACFLPDTPNSMIDRDQPEKARALLRQIRGVNDEEVEAEFNDLMAASKAAKEVKHPWKTILTNKYRPQLVMSILIPAFQQLTGINVVMFYAPVLFQTIGFGSNASLMSALITGGVNFLFTFVAVGYTDKWGRRILFILGGILLFVFQVALAGLIGWKFGESGVVTLLPEWFAIVVVACICVFVSAFAWSWGPLGWLVPSEIFPLEIRSAGQSITVCTNMSFTYLVAQFFLTMLCHMKYGLFIFFATLVAVMTGFVIFFVPETRNIPIEEMSQVWQQHWFWKQIVPNKEVKDLEIMQMI